MSISKTLSLKKTALQLLYILIALLPFISVLQNIIPNAGWIKDILCIFICGCALLNGKIKINSNLICVILYTIIVIFSILFNDTLSAEFKLNAFRYRCEYAITLVLLINSFQYSKEEIKDIALQILKILYVIGIIVAIIGCVELVNPRLVYSIYGNSLTTHLSVWTGDSLSASSRLISTLGNPINLGLQMVLAIGACLCLWHKSGKSNWHLKAIYPMTLVLFIVITIYTYSRTAYIMVGAVILAFYASQILFSKINLKKKVSLVLLIALCATILLILVNNYDSFAYRLNSISIKTFLENTRVARATTAFTADWKNLWVYLFGAGVGNRLGSSGQYVFEFGYASLLYETGIIGFIIFLCIIISSISSSLYVMKYELTDRYINSTYLSFIAAFCCGMFAEDLYFQSPFNLYFWICCLVLHEMRQEK